MASLPLLRLSLLPSSKPHSPSPISAIRIPHSIISTAKITCPKLSLSRAPTSMFYNPASASDRLISTGAYFSPFFRGIYYGFSRFILPKYPSLVLSFKLLSPLMNFYCLFEIVAFHVYGSVIRNPSFSRYVRFNAEQASVLDDRFGRPLAMLGIGFRFLMMGYEPIFDAMVVFIVACSLYSVGFCILGKTPYLPFVAGASDQLGFDDSEPWIELVFKKLVAGSKKKKQQQQQQQR